MGNCAWGKRRFEFSANTHSIDDLKQTRFHRFTDNFIQAESMPGDADRFSNAD